MQALIVGATSFGLTLSICARRAGHQAVVLCRSAGEADQLDQDREHRRLMPGVPLPPELRFTDRPPQTPPDAVIWAVPSQRLRENLRAVLPRLPDAPLIHASAAKGLERSTRLRMTEVIRQELSAAVRSDAIAAISGPNLAAEIVRGMPAAAVAASTDHDARERVRDLLTSPAFRVYTNDDVIGVELGGALKNVIAIAMGTAVGLGAGDNARAALFTRGLAEIARLGAAMGASPATFAGLAGLGDLLATANSPNSRNRTLGERIGQGMTPAQAQADTPHVVEGVETTRVVLELADSLGVDMPVAQVVGRVLFDGLDPREAVPLLMERALRDEGL